MPTRKIVRKTTKPPTPKPPPVSTSHYSSGSSLLNLACSDSISAGFGLGRMNNLIGDSSSGKTFVALTCLAEAAHSPHLKDYRLIFDDVESACSFNIKRLFGKALDDRLEDPDNDHSNTVQDFLVNLDDCLKGDQPFIYVLDSFDALTSTEDGEQIAKLVKAHRKDEDPEKGSYQTQKPKVASMLFRYICRDLEQGESALIVISQTRDAINSMFKTKTRSGGRALKFYATHEMWTAVVKTIKKGKIPLGVQCQVKVTKNKLTGKVRTVEFPIYYDYGVDDIGSMVDYLIAEKVWGKQGATINPKGMGGLPKATRNKIISTIEDSEKLEDALKVLVQATWDEVEEAAKLNRKRRFR